MMINRMKWVGFLMLFAAASQAQLSCVDLDSAAADLDDIAEALTEVESIGINTDLDAALDELVDALYSIAEVEDDARFDAKVDQLDAAWEAANRDSFEGALDDLIERLDALASRDCG